MFHFLGFLFIIMVFVLVTGLSLIGALLRSIFGIGRQHTNSDTYQQRSSQSQSSKGYSFSSNRQQDNASQTTDDETSYYGNSTHRKRKKFIAKDEGEYVDFEEVSE